MSILNTRSSAFHKHVLTLRNFFLPSSLPSSKPRLRNISIPPSTRFYSGSESVTGLFSIATLDRTFLLASATFQTYTYFTLRSQRMHASFSYKKQTLRVIYTRKVSRTIYAGYFGENSSVDLSLKEARSAAASYDDVPLSKVNCPSKFIRRARFILFFSNKVQTLDFRTSFFSPISRICVRCRDIFVKEESTSH